MPTAILKYHNTEMSRRVADDAMDIHGGKGVMRGPTNYLATAYTSLPISITVEGANILTRNLIIFGQGAIRCHPYVLREMRAAADEDPVRSLETFDRLIFGHVGYALSNAMRSFVLGLTHGHLSAKPTSARVGRYYQHINRFSAAFALACDASMFLVGGELKRKEQLSARLGDILSYLYLGSMVLKHHQDQGSPADDVPLVEWSCRTLMYNGPAATGRAAPQPPEPLGRRAAANPHLPPRQDLLPASRPARPANRGPRHPSHRSAKPP